MLINSFEAGVNTFEIFGFEGCCDGKNAIKY
jgi:hypothetical protein